MVAAICDTKSFTETSFLHTSSVGPSETQDANSNIGFFFIASLRSSAKLTPRYWIFGYFSGVLAETPVCDWLWVWRRNQLMNASSRDIQFVLKTLNRSKARQVDNCGDLLCWCKTNDIEYVNCESKALKRIRYPLKMRPRKPNFQKFTIIGRQ